MAPVMTRLLRWADAFERDAPLIIYCCENDHDAVKDLKETLRGRAIVVDCMVEDPSPRTRPE